MLRTREDYISYMLSEKTDRPFFSELFGPLPALEKEWEAQGASEGELNLTSFCFDTVQRISLGANSARNTFEYVVLEETDEYIIHRDYLGRKDKLMKNVASIPLPLEYPVTDRDSWLKLKHMYEYDEGRIAEIDFDAAKAFQAKGGLVCVGIVGGFNTPRELMGDEAACFMYYDDPELMHDIIQTLSDTAYRTLEKISSQIVIDQMTVHEDMAGKSGSLVGPDMIREFITPYYRRQWDLLNSRGTRLFSQDSDGNMNSVMDEFVRAGVNIFYPMEPAAGMDMVESRKKYGKSIAYKGGIDKHVLRQSKEHIKAELEYKLQPMMREGGVVFGLDHRIPNGTPLENYRYYINTAREMLGLEPVSQAEKGMTRMAF